MKLAICYLTCTKNDLNFNLQHLINHIKTSKYCNDIDLYKYVNDETSTYQINENTIKFSYGTITKKFNYPYRFYNSTGGTDNLSGIQIFTLLDLFLVHREYDYYMFYEDDVLLNTNKNLFDTIDWSANIILQDPRIIDYEWSWYKPTNHNLKNCVPYSGLLNIYTVKKELLIEFILNIINKHYVGHHELLFNHFALTYHRNKIGYLSDKYDVLTQYYKIEEYDKQYDIIHPVKTEEEYNKFIKDNII